MGSETTAFFVSGIYRNITPSEIEEHFTQYGQVISFKPHLDSQGRSCGYGYLRFAQPPSQAMLTDTHALQDATIVVAPMPTGSAASVAHRQATTASQPPQLKRENHFDDDGEKTPTHTVTAPPKRRRMEPLGGMRADRFVAPPPPPPSLPAQVGRDRFIQSPLAKQLQPDPGQTVREIHEPREIDRSLEVQSDVQNKHESLPPPPPPGPPPPPPPGPPPPPPPQAQQEAQLLTQLPTPPPFEHVFACIPVAMCPPQFLYSPFVLYAKLDPSRMDGLSFTQHPMLNALQAPQISATVQQTQPSSVHFPLVANGPVGSQHTLPLPSSVPPPQVPVSAPCLQKDVPPPPPGPPPPANHTISSASSKFRRATY